MSGVTRPDSRRRLATQITVAWAVLSTVAEFFGPGSVWWAFLAPIVLAIPAAVALVLTRTRE